MSRRVVVIGGGTNGLAAATWLARSGRSVTLVERREILGGLAAGEAFHPGFTSPGLLHESSTLRPAVVRALELERHGLTLEAHAGARLALERSGPGLWLSPNASETASAIGERSVRDAESYRDWLAFVDRVRGFVAGLLTDPAPDMTPTGALSKLDLLKTGVSLRRLGRDDMLELMRVAPQAGADWMQDTFEDALVGAALLAPALVGTWLGPWSAGSAAALLAHTATSVRSVVGGPHALANALESAARASGVEIELGARVRELALADERVCGVHLEDGRSIDADAVLSTIDPKQTFLELVPRTALSFELEEAALAWRARGTTAKLHVALDGPFEDPAQRAIERATTGESIDELEQAFDAVKYGELPERPVLDISAHGEAPAGKTSLSILAHYVPHALRSGWDDAARAELEKRALGVLEDHFPGIGARVLACETLSPADIEARYATHGGHVHHGEHALDQLLVLRPNADSAHHATPIEGLFVGGSGSHPGGGITCAPGYLAAQRLLQSR